MKQNSYLLFIGTLFLQSLFISNSFATTANVSANISFAAVLTVTKNSDIDFGIVLANQSDTYTINTAGTVTSSGSGQSLGGAATAADLTIAGSVSQLINITANNYVINSGVTPQNATCSYAGGAETACSSLTSVAAAGAGTTLLVGVEAVVDGTQAAGSTAVPSFDVVVTYQ